MKSTTCDATPGGPAALAAAHLDYLLRLGDNALVLGQRLAEWCGHAPVLEEELALTNVSLDLIGQARLLLSHAGRLEGRGRDEDALAFLRDEGAFRNWTLMELPNGDGRHDDYAVTILRNCLASALQVALWQALTDSSDEQLAAIAARSVKEARAHLRHAGEWVVRLGDGTELSHARMQAALERLWPYTQEFWSDDETERRVSAAGIGVLTASLRPQWEATIADLLTRATLTRPRDTGFLSTGKLGRHSEHLGYLLAEMQSLARQHPGAAW
ncbi:MAG: phenylacetate-CoA oxygenase subunit PaaC [Burkholderiales bacterium]|nr:phenylacetate-CoA oxygenase subunit PaaC [Burkholderiales bacterium]